MKKDWPTVLATGLELLKLNPWDGAVLADLATACQEMGHTEPPAVYLKAAVEGSPLDPELNRLLAKVLANLARFDEAILAWKRVLQAKPADEEAARAIPNLVAEKTINRGGYEEAESTKQLRSDKSSSLDDENGPRFTAKELLERAIKKNPSEIKNYVELADFHLSQDALQEAEEVLSKALEVSGGGDLQLKEKIEDIQLRHARRQLAIAEKKAQDERTPQAIELYNNVRVELNQRELEVYRNRCERYPSNVGFRYELAVRLHRSKNFSEAIKHYQEALGDTKRKGVVYLALGECFQSIKQYKLAMSNYDQALAEISDHDEHRKMALYRAGSLALGLKEFDKADKYLTSLAGIDYSFRDVSKLLDRLAQLRQGGDSNLSEVD